MLLRGVLRGLRCHGRGLVHLRVLLVPDAPNGGEVPLWRPVPRHADTDVDHA